jgi:hypothetical protein
LKYRLLIITFLNLKNKKFKQPLNFFLSVALSICRALSSGWHLTWWRLGAATAFTKRSAGYSLSNLHFSFRGVTAAVAPNRALAAGVLLVL